MSLQSKQSFSAARVLIPLGRGLVRPQRTIRSTGSRAAYQRPSTSACRKPPPALVGLVLACPVQSSEVSRLVNRRGRDSHP